jgi:PD-(D/E)XK nuclease superfamily
VLETEKYIYIFEFKFNKSALIAIRAIEKRGYAEKYALSGKMVIGIGMNFSSETRNIKGFKKKVLVER